jgi:hypothetical protein
MAMAVIRGMGMAVFAMLVRVMRRVRVRLVVVVPAPVVVVVLMVAGMLERVELVVQCMVDDFEGQGVEDPQRAGGHACLQGRGLDRGSRYTVAEKCQRLDENGRRGRMGVEVGADSGGRDWGLDHRTLAMPKERPERDDIARGGRRIACCEGQR